MRPLTPLLGCFAVVVSIQPVLAEPPDLAEVRARGFEVTKTDGTRVLLSELLPLDRPAVVEFWATWCGPCRKTTPSLQKLSIRYGSTKLTVLGLTIEDPGKHRDKVEKFATEEGITYPLAFSSQELFQFINQRDQVAVPKILVYDAKGEVVEHITSYSPLTARRVAKAVARVLGEE